MCLCTKQVIINRLEAARLGKACGKAGSPSVLGTLDFREVPIIP
jgi:hypothetical protein